jgi:hypothetical protein
MQDVVTSIGGTVRPEPDPEQELERLAGLTDEPEFAEWMIDYEAGRWLLVRLELFAELGATRKYDDAVHALSFGLPHGNDNLEHAREVVVSSVDALAAMLRRHGVTVEPDALAQLPVVVELAPEVEARLAR